MSKTTINECKNGHDIALSYVGYDGTRVCRRCRYNRVKRYRTNNLIKIRLTAGN